MAPTLLGHHRRGVCFSCGATAFGSSPPRRFDNGEAPMMICRDNFHVTVPQDYDNRVYSSDRFLACKILEPRRWDIVVFQNPEQPSDRYVMRLVGLPGETIVIEDGRVWANGQKLTRPESLSGIEYLSRMPRYGTDLWGTTDRPAQLGADEYFVLGDFSAMSADSRFWQNGAPGHNPFAVPHSHMQGVVTHIYWPPGRLRAFR